jgi:hypothetical protein
MVISDWFDYPLEGLVELGGGGGGVYAFRLASEWDGPRRRYLFGPTGEPYLEALVLRLMPGEHPTFPVWRLPPDAPDEFGRIIRAALDRKACVVDSLQPEGGERDRTAEG